MKNMEKPSPYGKKMTKAAGKTPVLDTKKTATIAGKSETKAKTKASAMPKGSTVSAFGENGKKKK
ncbi:MAG: hypothetical protein EBR82_48140 [Caulobacteraceae bacterium]|nr:hypothetical protein [Caulobacteraceae bacterium]